MAWPEAVLAMLRSASLLNDAAMSACIGRPVSWHSLWHEFERWRRGAGGDVKADEIYDAHLQLARKAWSLAAARC